MAKRTPLSLTFGHMGSCVEAGFVGDGPSIGLAEQSSINVQMSPSPPLAVTFFHHSRASLRWFGVDTPLDCSVERFPFELTRKLCP